MTTDLLRFVVRRAEAFIDAHVPEPEDLSEAEQDRLMARLMTLRTDLADAVDMMRAGTPPDCDCGATGPTPRTRHAPSCPLFDRGVDEAVAEVDRLRAEIRRMTGCSTAAELDAENDRIATLDRLQSEAKRARMELEHVKRDLAAAIARAEAAEARLARTTEDQLDCEATNAEINAENDRLRAELADHKSRIAELVRSAGGITP